MGGALQVTVENLVREGSLVLISLMATRKEGDISGAEKIAEARETFKSGYFYILVGKGFI